MDRNFNDQELSDIMKEIEALEENFASSADAPETSSTQASAITNEYSEEEDQVELESSSPHEEAVSGNESNILSFAPMKPTASNVTNSMSFKIQGDFAVHLNFDFNGKVVSLDVSESGLVVEMDGGVKFEVPVAKIKSVSDKKSA